MRSLDRARHFTAALDRPAERPSGLDLMLVTSHLGLTRDRIFTDNVLFWLLEDPRNSL